MRGMLEGDFCGRKKRGPESIKMREGMKRKDRGVWKKRPTRKGWMDRGYRGSEEITNAVCSLCLCVCARDCMCMCALLQGHQMLGWWIGCYHSTGSVVTLKTLDHMAVTHAHAHARLHARTHFFCPDSAGVELKLVLIFHLAVCFSILEFPLLLVPHFVSFLSSLTLQCLLVSSPSIYSNPFYFFLFLPTLSP